MNEKPEALRLADGIPITALYSVESAVWAQETAAELRRLHEVNQELVDALLAIKEANARDDGPRSGHTCNRRGSRDWETAQRNAYAKADAAIAKAKGESNETQPSD